MDERDNALLFVCLKWEERSGGVEQISFSVEDIFILIVY